MHFSESKDSVASIDKINFPIESSITSIRFLTENFKDQIKSVFSQKYEAEEPHVSNVKYYLELLDYQVSDARNRINNCSENGLVTVEKLKAIDLERETTKGTTIWEEKHIPCLRCSKKIGFFRRTGLSRFWLKEQKKDSK